MEKLVKDVDVVMFNSQIDTIDLARRQQDFKNFPTQVMEMYNAADAFLIEQRDYQQSEAVFLKMRTAFKSMRDGCEQVHNMAVKVYKAIHYYF